jgi:hypothetical protein
MCRSHQRPSEIRTLRVSLCIYKEAHETVGVEMKKILSTRSSALVDAEGYSIRPSGVKNMGRKNNNLFASKPTSRRSDSEGDEKEEEEEDANDRENQSSSETPANESVSQDLARPASPNSVQVPKARDAEAPAQDSSVKVIPPLSLRRQPIFPPFQLPCHLSWSSSRF